MSKLLTKSKFMSGLQCEKLLWTMFNAPKRIPPIPADKQFIFDQGNFVGNFAKKLFSNGIDIPYAGFTQSIAKTEELLLSGKTLFEASILAGELYSRIDIFNPLEDDFYEIIEVKSSTSVKEEHIWDVAFQKYCCVKKGLKIKDSYLVHLNNQYVRSGDLDLKELFLLEDISDRVDEVIMSLPKLIQEFIETIDLDACADISIGKYCLEPYECPLKDSCWSFLPDRSIFNLYYGGKTRFAFFENGIGKVEDIPDTPYLFNTDFTAQVPEPSSLVLLAFSLGALILKRRI